MLSVCGQVNKKSPADVYRRVNKEVICFLHMSSLIFRLLMLVFVPLLADYAIFFRISSINSSSSFSVGISIIPTAVK